MKEVFQQFEPDQDGEPFYWILPGELAGRCGPEMKPWNLGTLWDVGFRAIVSLHQLPGEEETALEESEFDHLPIYFPSMVIDKSALQKKFLSIVEKGIPFLDEQIQNNRASLVHCHAGLDRSSGLIGCYLIDRRGYTAERAIDTIKEANPDAFISPGYEEAVRRFEQQSMNLD